MSLFDDPDARRSPKPIPLEKTAQAVHLEMMIGTLGVEVWHSREEETQSYARLTFESQPHVPEGFPGSAEDGTRKLPVTLEWQQAFAISGAIREWMTYLESGIEDHQAPILHMEIASLTIDFYRPSTGQAPRMVCAIHTETGLLGEAILTCPEAGLLGRLLFCCLDDEEADQKDQEGVQ